jgi:Zn-dependent protease
MDAQTIIQTLLITMPVFLLSLSVHEAAHAAMADYLGDPTARYEGRVTLNPVPHIDILGTIILPIISTITSGFALVGWAKPVPVDWRNLQNVKRDDTLIAVAGPASNIVLSLVFLAGMAVLVLTGLNLSDGTVGEVLMRLFRYGVIINIALAVFNMIPIPPLDGSHVLANVLPPALSERYRAIGFYGVFLLLILLNFTPLRTVLNAVIGGIYNGYIGLLHVVAQ